jgi:tRNA threonylcarbamoyladenosine biosynthesis protein TsaE
MDIIRLISYSIKQTQRLGTWIGELSEKGDIIFLIGNLGSGKTCLTQGIAWGLGVEEYVFSPSFVLVREYHGRLPLYHIDLYRLNNIDEIAELMLDEHLLTSGVCVIEWAEKGAGVLPAETMSIAMSYISEKERSIELQPGNARYEELLRFVGTRRRKWN